jgi:hypothetical protein
MERASTTAARLSRKVPDRVVEGSFSNVLQEPKLTVPERWSRFKYRGRNGPKGSRDALERAKLVLGPLTSGHEPRLQVLCPCATCVEQNIIDIVTEFNARRLVIDGALSKHYFSDQRIWSSEGGTKNLASENGVGKVRC